ncbi:hypothetical protein [Maritimibacter sp. DP1N21-5]|uniref:hypothetical protein n=1 Tax=Maritimibacter sp. DP1N21-5 TaxID=2836867 RepID=UPI001C464334|nr:hypothetical protein [Maritimibacter sp. DP1N21-5]MBV7407907.1 hypothetical protein [Maritimibacter sp. DP1N21-5]
MTLSLIPRALALVLILSIGLLPRGIMPGWTGDGMTMVLCTGTGPLEVRMGADGVPVPVGDGPAETAPEADLCAWVALAAVAVAPSDQPGAEVPLTLRPVEAHYAKSEAGLGERFSPYDSRGPPRLL